MVDDSIYNNIDLSLQNEEILAVDIEDVIRMNADCMAVQTFIGGDGQLSSLDNLSKAVNLGMRYSIRSQYHKNLLL